MKFVRKCKYLLLFYPYFYRGLRYFLLLKIFEILIRIKIYISFTLYLTLICLMREGANWNPICGFLINVSSIERLEPCFFVTFNTMLKHISPENFIGFPQVIQKIWRNYLSILATFINFPQFLEFLLLPCYKESNDVSL